jgi:dUTP pyrophosphatase
VGTEGRGTARVTSCLPCLSHTHAPGRPPGHRREVHVPVPDDGAAALPPGAVPGALEVLVRRLDPEVPLPAYARPGDAGCDLVTTVDVELAPGERALLPTGLALALPEGYAAFVHPRSGLAARHGVGLVNAPGTVDAGYRGELQVALVNHDLRETVRLRRLDRVAQLVVQRVEQVAWREVSGDLPVSDRGAGGHGSTGGWADARPGTPLPAGAAALHAQRGTAQGSSLATDETRGR